MNDRMNYNGLFVFVLMCGSLSGNNTYGSDACHKFKITLVGADYLGGKGTVFARCLGIDDDNYFNKMAGKGCQRTKELQIEGKKVVLTICDSPSADDKKNKDLIQKKLDGSDAVVFVASPYFYLTMWPTWVNIKDLITKLTPSPNLFMFCSLSDCGQASSIDWLEVTECEEYHSFENRMFKIVTTDTKDVEKAFYLIASELLQHKTGSNNPPIAKKQSNDAENTAGTNSPAFGQSQGGGCCG